MKVKTALFTLISNACYYNQSNQFLSYNVVPNLTESNFRYLLSLSVISPVLSEIQNKIHILEDMQKLGVLLKPIQLDREDKQELLWICISNSSNNYRQVSGNLSNLDEMIDLDETF